MPVGSPRPHTGRPKSAKAKAIARERKLIPVDLQRAAKNLGLTPLDYTLAVMRDEEIEPERRDRAAAIAMPFMHARVADAPLGKKELANEAAKMPDRSSALGELMARRQGVAGSPEVVAFRGKAN